MLDDEEWDWITEHATGDVDHLLIATSLPFLLGRGMHYLEAWNEAVAGGAGAGRGARLGERLRRAVDLEHWAAFQRSFAALAELQRAVAAGERGEAPGLDRDPLRRRAPRLPLRGRLPARLRRPQRGLAGRVLALPQPARRARAARDQLRDVARRWRRSRALLGRAAGVRIPRCAGASVGDGPWFDNQVATLTIDGRRIDDAPRQGGAGGRHARPPRVRAGAALGLRPQLRVVWVVPTRHPITGGM